MTLIWDVTFDDIHQASDYIDRIISHQVTFDIERASDYQLVDEHGRAEDSTEIYVRIIESGDNASMHGCHIDIQA